MAYVKWLVVIAAFGLANAFMWLIERQERALSELKDTVDFLNSSDNDMIIVINENIKSKQDRTRIKIEELIALNNYHPLPYSEMDNMARIVVKYSERYQVPINLVLAVMTAESGFYRMAVSHAGALGATQVMPETAQDIAHELGIPECDLFGIDCSIRFGTYYLHKMLKHFKGNTELAVMAYNAGPDNINRKIYPRETLAYRKAVMSTYHWLEKRNIRCGTSE